MQFTKTISENERQKEIRRDVERIDKEIDDLIRRQEKSREELSAAVKPFQATFEGYQKEHNKLVDQRQKLADEFHSENERRFSFEVGSTAYVGNDRVVVKEVWYDYLFIEAANDPEQAGTIHKSKLRADWDEDEIPTLPGFRSFAWPTQLACVGGSNERDIGVPF